MSAEACPALAPLDPNRHRVEPGGIEPPIQTLPEGRLGHVAKHESEQHGYHAVLQLPERVRDNSDEPHRSCSSLRAPALANPYAMNEAGVAPLGLNPNHTPTAAPITTTFAHLPKPCRVSVMPRLQH